MTSPTFPTRRAVLGAVGAGWLMATAGCDLFAADSPRDEPAPARAGTTGPEDTDQTLLDSVRTATVAAADLLSATLDQHPALAGSLLALVDLHAVHLAALTGEDEATSTPDSNEPATPPTPTDADEARRLVTDTETSLLTLLTRSALEAESGRFARLLSSTAAGLSQQLTRSRALSTDAT